MMYVAIGFVALAWGIIAWIFLSNRPGSEENRHSDLRHRMIWDTEVFLAKNLAF